jgi:hypothetical protein
MIPAPRFVVSLPGVAYDFHRQVRRAPGNQQLRMSYHDGILEIMFPLYKHERESRRIGLIVLAVTSVLGIPEMVLEALNLGTDLSDSEWDQILRSWVRDKLSRA